MTLARTFLVLAGLACGLCLSCELPEHPAPPAPVKVTPVTLFDPDPGHLWNRIYGSLNTWQLKGSTTVRFDPDPLGWPSDEYWHLGDQQRAAVPLLDEFLKTDGERLIRDPLRRALFQSNLWMFYDWAASARERDLERRLAAVMKRVALTPAEIRTLPDTYAAAVASGAYRAAFDPDHPDHPFLPAELLDPSGPWVLLGDDRKGEASPLARKHVTFFEGRAGFMVFLKLPNGRPQVSSYLEALRSPTRSPPDAIRVGTGGQVALLRRAFVLDDGGVVVPTPIVESLQFRVIGDYPAGRKLPPGMFQRVFKFELRRQPLLAGERGGLMALGLDDVEPIFVQLLGFRAPQGDQALSTDRPLTRCFFCHTIGGDLESRARMFFDAPRPTLAATTMSEEERRVAAWKGRESSFQRLLQYWKGAR